MTSQPNVSGEANPKQIFLESCAGPKARLAASRDGEHLSAMRVEGHHLSQNYTLANGQIVNGPSFFGSNPSEVQQGLRKGLRTLAREDDLGFEVIHALDEPEQKIAIVDPKG